MKYFLFSILVLIGTLARADANLLEDARGLLKSGKFNDAFNRLLPYEYEYSGELEYDYLLGVAALESQHVEIAVFALERSAENSPDSAYVLADLARAYSLLGEHENARTTLERARQRSHDRQTTAAIEQQMETLGLVDKRGRLDAFLEFGVGYNSNINSAIGSRNIVIPAFGGFNFSLASTSVKLDSPFIQKTVGIEFGYPFQDRRTTFFARLSGTQRTHARNKQFDTSSLDVLSSINHVDGPHYFSLSLQHGNFALDGTDYYYDTSVHGQWLTLLSPRVRTGLFVQGGQLEYPTARLRDAKRYVGGVFLSETMSLSLRNLLYASLYAGKEVTEISFLGHHLVGARVGLQLFFRENLSIHLGMGYESRGYGGIDPLFLVGRKDRQQDLTLGIVYGLAKGFSLRPSLNWVDNHSNVALNQFNRLEAILNVRKDF
ncbi:outer membrane protein [Gammaproteobacteria bacterium]